MLVGFRCQDYLDNASPSYAGDAGLGKTPAVRRLMQEADVILAVGVRFGEILTDGYSLFEVPAMAAALIHAHASDAELDKVETAALPLHAHPDTLMPALAGLASPARRLGGADRGGARRLAGEPRHAAAARRARHGRGGAPPAGGAAAGRDPDQRRRQLRHLDQQASSPSPEASA